jgi:hypothetical protein
MDPQTQQLLQQLGLTANNASGAMQQLISALSKTTSASNNQTNAATLTAQSLQQLQGSSGRLATAFGSTLSIGTSLIGSLTSITSTVYGADKAFTSVIPTLDALSSIFKKTVTAAGQLASGTSFLGTSFGRASEAIASGATAVMDIITDQLKFQLQSAQQVADSFLEVAKAGATFGGSIQAFASAAARAHMPLQEFGRFIVQNNETLSKLGKSITKAAVDAISFGRALYKDNDVLVALYKNIEGLSQGAAEYLALQNQLGAGAKLDEQGLIRQRKSVEEYLIRQKELSAITGKNTDTLRREEEGRRKQLDYNLKLGRLGDEARKNVQEGMAIAGKVFGDSGAKYAEEYFATGGKVFSAEAIAYASTNQEAADAISNLMSTVNSSREQYRKGYGQYFAANADTLEAAARSNEDLAEISRAAANPIIRGMAETGAAIMQSGTLIRNMTAMLQEIEEEGKRLRSGKPGDAATQAFVDAERERAKVQIKIDETVLDNMKKIGSVTDFLNRQTMAYVEAQKDVGIIIQKLKQALEVGSQVRYEDFVEWGKSLINAITGKLGVGPPPAPVVPESGGGAPVQPGNLGTRGASLPGGPTLAQAAPSDLNAKIAEEYLATGGRAFSVEAIAALADLRRTNQAIGNNNTEIAAQFERLQTQIASLTNANDKTDQFVAALNNQNNLMETLNDKMGDMIDSNRNIFNALA